MAIGKADDQAAELVAAHLEHAERPEAALLALDNAAAAELAVLTERGARHRCGALMLEAGLVAFYGGDGTAHPGE